MLHRTPGEAVSIWCSAVSSVAMNPANPNAPNLTLTLTLTLTPTLTLTLTLTLYAASFAAHLPPDTHQAGHARRITWQRGTPCLAVPPLAPAAPVEQCSTVSTTRNAGAARTSNSAISR